MSRSSTRARRNQQIFFLILSVLVVVSMGVSLIATFIPEPRRPVPVLSPSATLPAQVPVTFTATPDWSATPPPATP